MHKFYFEYRYKLKFSFLCVFTIFIDHIKMAVLPTEDNWSRPGLENKQNMNRIMPVAVFEIKFYQDSAYSLTYCLRLLAHYNSKCE